MTWVIILGLLCVAYGLHKRCRELETTVRMHETALRVTAEQRDVAMAHYDCLAEKYEDLLESQPEWQYAHGEEYVEDDELTDALISDNQRLELEWWYSLPSPGGEL